MKLYFVSIGPHWETDYFLNKIDNILYTLHNYKGKFIICGVININYLGTNIKKKQLDNFLATYNLTGTVYFPTRIADNSVTLLDNIFVNYTRKCTIQLCINGLSGRDKQLITLHNFLYQLITLNLLTSEISIKTP